MKNNIKGTFFFLLICYSFIGINQILYAQDLGKTLETKLSSGAKKKMESANALKQQGTFMEQKAIDTQAQTTINSELDKKKAEQKYSLKRMEAGEMYINAVHIKYEVLKEGLKDFWKKYKGDKHALTLLKTYEIASLDSLKKGFELKKKNESITKISDRLANSLLLEALLNKYLLLLEKVSYCYLNWPLEYEQQWLLSAEDQIPGKNIQQTTSLISTKDSVNKHDAPKDSFNRDTTARMKAFPVQPKDTVNDIKPLSNQIIKADTTKIQKIVIMPEKTKVTPAQTPVPVIKSGTMAKDSATPNLKDSLVSSPANYQGNDSSLYGIVKINEEDVDQFNGFLKKKYPEKYEDYVINFQDMDYSNVEELKKSWYRYRYGSYPGDSANDKSVFKKVPGDSSSARLAMNDRIINSSDSSMHSTSNNVKESTSYNQHPLKGNNKKNNSNEITSEHAEKRQNTSDSYKATGDFVFHVQIVACRTRMNMGLVRNLCNCKDSIMEFKEDNWYKYAIGTFNTYREARTLRDGSKIPGAFVIAYLHGKRIRITPAIAYKKRGNSSLRNSKN